MERQAKDGTFYKQVGSDEWEPVTRTAKNGTVYKKIGEDDWSPVAAEEPPERKPEGGGFVETLGQIANTVDSYTGAPARAAIGAAQDGRFSLTDNPVTAYAQQFGGNPELAPTGKQIVKKMGVDDTTKLSDVLSGMYSETGDELLKFKKGGMLDPTTADVAGVAMDIAADPLNIIPGTGAAKSAAKATGQTAKAATKVVEKSSGGLKKFAEKMAVNATGATGKQSAEFADDAGRQLLDRKIVRFGDTQEKIAQRASAASEAAYKDIDEALTSLEKSGASVDANQIYDTIRKKITDIAKDPSQADIAAHLEKELDNLVNASQARGGSKMAITEAEKIKRGYNRKAGNWMDPERGMAGKEMYQAFRESVENAAKADPKLATKFEEGKKTYGLLAPIQEAAEKRARTLAQSQPVNLLDIVTGAPAAVAAGPLAGVAVPLARRAIAPRVASAVAVSADKMADMLRKIPDIKAIEEASPERFQNVVELLIGVRGAASVGTSKAANSKEEKGPEKWARDGFENIVNHAPPEEREKLTKMRDTILKTPKLRESLIVAADVKPGTKAMDRLLKDLTGGNQ